VRYEPLLTPYNPKFQDGALSVIVATPILQVRISAMFVLWKEIKTYETGTFFNVKICHDELNKVL
jgi:hypothetical protein